jgi:hypothetical protein
MAHRHPASEGMGFRIGGTDLYVGPPATGNGNPILALTRRGQKVTIVSEFRNATSAAFFIEALQQGLDEANGGPANTIQIDENPASHSTTEQS